MATAALALGAALWAQPARAHPAPFSYVDVRIDLGAVTVTVIAHVFDLGHDLGVSPPERLLDRSVLADRSAAIAALIESRLRLLVDGQLAAVASSAAPEALDGPQSVRVRLAYDLDRSPGLVTVAAMMFPYDPAHQTFVSFYDGDALATQAILDARLTQFDYFPGTAHGAGAAASRFLWEGVGHVLTGPDHLILLAGLLLLGGSRRQMLFIVTGFTTANAVALALAMFHVMMPPERIVEPALALGLVYLGADNLLVRDGRDARLWIASAFGFIHGFSTVIRGVGLSRAALVASLASFNIGLEIGQLAAMAALGFALTALRSKGRWTERQLAVAGSIVVIAIGALWFVARVYFASAPTGQLTPVPPSPQ